jgi:hypothetical protein
MCDVPQVFCLQHRLVPTLVGAERVFGGSKVIKGALGCLRRRPHAVTEAGEVWVWGRRAQGRLGLNDEQDRLVPTRVDPQQFAHAPISAVAAGDYHSAAVKAGGALHLAKAQVKSDFRGSGGLGHLSRVKQPVYKVGMAMPTL